MTGHNRGVSKLSNLYGASVAKLPSAEAIIADIAVRHHGLASYDMMLARGVTRRQIQRRVQRGALLRIFHRVYAVGHAPTSRLAWWLAHILAVRHPAALSGVAGAEVLGFSRWPARRPTIVVPVRQGSVGNARIIQSRRFSLREVEIHRRVPVTNAARTLLELAGEGFTKWQVANAIHRCAYSREVVLNTAAIERCARRHANRPDGASRVLLDALALHRAGSRGTRSALEDKALVIARQCALQLHLGPPEINIDVQAFDGLIEVDQSWPHLRVCFEIDGPAHQSAAQRSTDQRRDARLQRAGWTVARFTHDHVCGTPHRTQNRMYTLLRDALSRRA